MSVVVIGTGHTKFGELWEKGIQDLLFNSQMEALVDAGIDAQSNRANDILARLKAKSKE